MLPCLTFKIPNIKKKKRKKPVGEVTRVQCSWGYIWQKPHWKCVTSRKCQILLLQRQKVSIDVIFSFIFGEHKSTNIFYSKIHNNHLLIKITVIVLLRLSMTKMDPDYSQKIVLFFITLILLMIKRVYKVSMQIISCKWRYVIVKVETCINR